MNASRTVSWLGASLILAGIFPTLTFAADIFSASFLAKNPIIDAFGGFGSSTGFSAFWSGSQTATGESASTNFALAAGFLYFDSFTPESQQWRWYSDYSNETPSTPLGAENFSPLNINNGDTLKLRITVNEIADIGAAGAKFFLQYSTSSDFSTGAIWVVEQGSCTGSSLWCYANGGGSDNGVITTGLLSDADSCVAGVGTGCGTHNESAVSVSTVTHQRSAATEYEFTIVQSGAPPNTTYFFRLVNAMASTSVPLKSGASYPSVATGGTTLSAAISGIASSTAVEGVTTDIDTTATGVHFGALPLGTPITAAQQITVSTNANSGYRIYAFQRQGLLDAAGSEIDPVVGTNASPVAWTSGCVADSGCYGYHAGDDVLLGGSARFAPNDTYAAFTGSADEVAYSAGPATDRTTNMVYRVEARTLQEAGQYSSSIVYIVVPVF
jgi:hypothetical protein